MSEYITGVGAARYRLSRARLGAWGMMSGMSGWDPEEFEALARQMDASGHTSAAVSLFAAAANIRNTGQPGVVCDEYCRCHNDVRRVAADAPPHRPGVMVMHVEPADGAALDVHFDASDDSYELNVFAPVVFDEDCDCCADEPD